MITIRSFIAVRLNVEIVKNIMEIQKKLESCSKESDVLIKWVPPPNIHLTLRFLGQIAEPMVHSICQMLEPVTKKTDAFDLDISDLIVLPHISRPRIISLGIGKGHDKLAALQDKLSKCLTEAGFNLDDKPFVPHITIGRFKRGKATKIKEFATLDFFNAGTTTVRDIACYLSDFNPKGAEYQILWRLELYVNNRNVRQGAGCHPPLHNA